MSMRYEQCAEIWRPVNNTYILRECTAVISKTLHLFPSECTESSAGEKGYDVGNINGLRFSSLTLRLINAPRIIFFRIGLSDAEQKVMKNMTDDTALIIIASLILW